MSAHTKKYTLPISSEEILADFQLAVESREASILGRKEVFMGKAKFGIFGDGKELPQIALSKFFKNGDWRSGYYRDQTLMMAIGQHSIEEFFAQLYANTDVELDPASAGRMMNGHFGTRFIDDNGNWKNQTQTKNSSSDISPTGGQMPRLLGLAYASKLYRNNEGLKPFSDFSINGNEIAFGTIGNASTSEGHFWESMNAAGVLQVPLVMSVWDDDYGISVPQKFHTTKQSISEALAGFQRTKDKEGFEIFTVKAWDYPALLETYEKATKIAREEHVPCLVHVVEVTQPQGHSTSGSHERYKSKERLEWEKANDCILKMKEWIVQEGFATADQVDEIEKEGKSNAKNKKNKSWKAYIDPIKSDAKEVGLLVGELAMKLDDSLKNKLELLVNELNAEVNPQKLNVVKTAKKAIRLTKNTNSEERTKLKNWIASKLATYEEQYNSKLYDESEKSSLNTETIPAVYGENAKLMDGREILNVCFNHYLETNPRFLAFGEDVGNIGDVNQGFAGLQAKYGDLRVTDTGIREATIVGQGIGSALRGLRPIAEIQYLDYLLYGLQTLSDDLATLHYRTYGGQKAPLIIRTRGHRLEGIWHSGSPMGMILNSLKGMYVLTPRNMTQAAGFYNTLMKSDDPALVIESLNGYRLKEQLPENITEFQLALGVPEILREGNDVTVVTYGSSYRIVLDVAKQLAEEENISLEVIDAQTLIPFDKPQIIKKSLEKTNRLVVIDEDVEGGASAFILQQVLERDNGYFCLDSQPLTITGKNHRPAYGTDGDYFSKPNAEEIFEKIYDLVRETNPSKYPTIY